MPVKNLTVPKGTFYSPDLTVPARSTAEQAAWAAVMMVSTGGGSRPGKTLKVTDPDWKKAVLTFVKLIDVYTRVMSSEYVSKDTTAKLPPTVKAELGRKDRDLYEFTVAGHTIFVSVPNDKSTFVKTFDAKGALVGGQHIQQPSSCSCD